MKLRQFGKLFTLLVLSCALALSHVPNAMAVDDGGLLSDENSRISNGIFYYNPNDTCGAAAAPTVVAPINTSGPNVEAILRFLVGKGLTLGGAAGVAGNLKQESGLNPKIIQGGATAPDNYTLVSGVGFGLAQWTSGGRQKALMSFAKARSTPVTDLTVQLEFLWHELSTDYKVSTLNKMTGVNDPVQAAIIFHDGFERSADSDSTVRNVRGGNAKSYYNQYKGKIDESAVIVATDPADAGTITDAADTTSCTPTADSTETDLGGGTGEANGVTFPLKTTQAIIKKGVDGAVWCFSNQSNCHHDYNAADIFAPTGTPIIAAKPGKVVNKTTGSCVYAGCNVSVKGDDGLLYYYTHMDKHAIVNVGQKVQAGQQLGAVGTNATAMNTAHHLHFDITRGAFRPSCSGSSCNDSDFINVQPVLIPAFNKLPAGGSGTNV